MRLFEVVQPLLESKVEHIAKNQAVKIAYVPFGYDNQYIMVYNHKGQEINPNTSNQQLFLDSLLAYHLRRRGPDHPPTWGKILQFTMHMAYVRAITINEATTEEEAKQNLLDGLEEVAKVIVQFMADNIGKKHLQWLVNRYIKFDYFLEEDHRVIKESLDIYDQMKSEIGVQLTNKVSIADLFDMTEPYKDVMDAEAAKAKEKELLAKGEIEIPFSQGPKELVIIPKTFKASKYLSEPNGWCTQHENWFSSYTRDDQTLYYFRHQGKPYLVHFESNQFKKKGNRDFDVKSVRESSPAFQWIIGQKKKEVENMQDDDPSKAAYLMVRNGYAEPEWTMKVIENDKTGDPSWAVYWMVRNGHTNDTEWAMKVIENAKTGNPSQYAYLMVEDGHTNDTEWATKVIENDKTGDPSWAAYFIMRNGHTKDIEWAMRIIENDKTGDPSRAAYWMVSNGLAPQEWAMKVIENAKTGDPSSAAYEMVEEGYAPQEWYDEHFG